MSTSWNDVLTPSGVGVAVAPKLSAEKLTEIWLSAPTEPKSWERVFPLDDEQILKAILKTEDVAKELVALRLASPQESSAQNALLDAAQKSPAHRCAFLSNRRLDWYYPFGSFFDTLKSKVLRPPSDLSQISDPLEIDEAEPCKEYVGALCVAAANERMNRRIIAESIRGVEPFDRLSPSIRSRIALEAATYFSKPRPYDLKDYPDDPPAEFLAERKPIEAYYALVKEGDGEIYPTITEAIEAGEFSINDNDWLNEAEKEKLSVSKFRERETAALKNFVSFMIGWSKHEPEGREHKEKEIKARELYKGTFAMASLCCALQKLDLPSFLEDEDEADRKARKSAIEAAKSSKSWVGRAAYYAFRINKISGLRSARQQRKDFKELLAEVKGDRLPFLRAWCSAAKAEDLKIRYEDLPNFIREPSSIDGISDEILWIAEYGPDLEAFRYTDKPSLHKEVSDSYFDKEALLTSAKQADRFASWAIPALAVTGGLFGWVYGLKGDAAVLLAAIVIAVGAVLSLVYRLHGMLLRMELREILRSGAVPRDRELDAISRAKRQERRWWQF